MTVPDRIAGMAHMVAITGFSNSTVRLTRDGHFPRRRALNARAVGWLESELQTWLQAPRDGEPNALATQSDLTAL